VTAAAIAGYLRALALGTAAHLLRVARGRPCPCDICAGHRAFIRESATAYRAEVRALMASHEGGA
jgi:hypothetical protein